MTSVQSRRDGWWGIAFALGLLVVAAMVSLPTAAESGERIKAFYDLNRQVIIIQQIVGALLLVPFLGFILALDRRARAPGDEGIRWFLLAGLIFAVAELATNLPPIALATMSNASPTTAHTLTLVADVADAALFVAIAFFAVIVARSEASWLRIVALVIAVVTFVRAFASPLGVTVLDAAAPLAFLLFALVLSVRILITDRPRAAR